MTIRILLAAALLVPTAVRAQGWGSEGTDPNHPASAAPASAPASAPAPKRAAAPKKSEAPKIRPVAREEDSLSGSSELDDAGLDRSRVLVDRQLAARKAGLAAQTQRLEGYHLAMEKDSLDAERQMAEERKAFLLYLKSVPQEDRSEAMKKFEERQDVKRKDLDKRHLSQYKAWFEESISDNWRTQPLSAESASMPAAVATNDAPAEAPAAAPAPAAKPRPKPAVKRAKPKKRARRPAAPPPEQQQEPQQAPQPPQQQ